MNTDAQKLQIQRWLAAGHSLTKLQALRKFGCWNLGGRIYDLRAERWPIKTRMVTRKDKRIAEYSMVRK